MADIHLSVVIVNYNVKDLLVKCIDTLYSTLPVSITIETIVVDNNSQDGSVETIEKRFPQVTIIANKFNAGFSGANNQGMSIAKGKFIFLLNPDTEIVADAIPQLLNYITNNPSCAIVVPQLLNSDGSIQTSVWKNYSVVDMIMETFYIHKFVNLFYYPADQLKTTFEAKTLSGAALFFRKELIDKIGMLDEHLFWMEDVDFSVRAQKCGALIYFPKAQVIHHSGQSQKKNYNMAISNQLISKLKYFKKHSSVFTVLVADIVCFVFIITRLLVFSLLSPFKQKRLKANAYLFTLKRYFNYLFLNDKSIS